MENLHSMKNNIASLQRIINHLIYVLDKKQKRGAVKVFLCMIFASLLDLLGVSAIYPFLQMLLSPETLIDKWYIAWIYLFFPKASFQFILLFIKKYFYNIYCLYTKCLCSRIPMRNIN